MAARLDPSLKGVLHGRKIVLHGLAARHFQFFEDVVIAAGDEDARLPDAKIAHGLEVLPAGADPGRDLREFQAEVHAALDGLAVALGVDEKLGLADQSVGSAEAREQLEERDDLIGRIGVDGLLPVTERGIGDPDILRHVHRDAAVVEGHLRHLVIAVNIAV